MRLFASKNIGHGIRIGVSEDASRLFGTRHPARAARHAAVAADVAQAIADAETQHANLERSAAELGANVAEIARHVATFDVDLALARATRDSAPTPAARVEWDTIVARIETSRAGWDALLRQAAAGHAQGLAAVANNRATLTERFAAR